MDLEWKAVPDWPLYQVSNDGKVRSFHRKRPAVLKPFFPGQSGEPWVELYRDGEYCQVSVVEVLAAAFLGPRPLGRFAARIDRTQGWTPDNVEYTQTWAASRGPDKKGQRVPFSTRENALADVIVSNLAESTARELIELLKRAVR